MNPPASCKRQPGRAYVVRDTPNSLRGEIGWPSREWDQAAQQGHEADEAR